MVFLVLLDYLSRVGMAVVGATVLVAALAGAFWGLVRLGGWVERVGRYAVGLAWRLLRRRG